LNETVDNRFAEFEEIAMNRVDKFSAALSIDDVAYFCSAVGVAPRVIAEARKAVTKRYDLGPRGAWLLGMIDVGVNSPSRLSELMCIGRSLMTAELTRMTKAGLIESRKDAEDGRRLTLSLTRKGKAACDELQMDVTNFVNKRLASFSHDEIMLCVRLLHAFSGSEEQYFEPGKR